MYNIIGYLNDKIYTLQENGDMCSTFNSKPRKCTYLTDAKRYADKIAKNRPYKDVSVIDEDTKEIVYIA